MKEHQGNKHKDAIKKQSHQYPKGTYVIIKVNKRQHKLHPTYQGLYIITDHTKMGNYVLQHIKGPESKTPIHPDQLRPIPYKLVLFCSF